MDYNIFCRDARRSTPYLDGPPKESKVGSVARVTPQDVFGVSSISFGR